MVAPPGARRALLQAQGAWGELGGAQEAGKDRKLLAAPVPPACPPSRKRPLPAPPCSPTCRRAAAAAACLRFSKWRTHLQLLCPGRPAAGSRSNSGGCLLHAPAARLPLVASWLECHWPCDRGGSVCIRCEVAGNASGWATGTSAAGYRCSRRSGGRGCSAHRADAQCHHPLTHPKNTNTHAGGGEPLPALKVAPLVVVMPDRQLQCGVYVGDVEAPGERPSCSSFTSSCCAAGSPCVAGGSCCECSAGRRAFDTA